MILMSMMILHMCSIPGKAWVGFMAALLVFSAAAVSLCLPRLTEIYGKNVVIAVGNCTFIFSGLVV